ncbi:MAG TPA: peptidase C39 family protein [Candidatus Pacearchaeota archaeon]|nr:peptidase C39 family protein [Candidatus Pacearchaeota archaeon]
MKLNVPFVKSLKKWKGNGWCGPLSLACILRYYGFKDNVEEIAKKARASEKGGGTVPHGLINLCLNKNMKVIYFSEEAIISENNLKYTKEMRKLLSKIHSKDLEKGFYNDNKKNKNFVYKKQKAKIKDVEKFLDQERPVLIMQNAAVLFNKNMLWPHYIVIVGYDKSYFYIHNVAVKNQRFQKVNKQILEKSWNCGGIKNSLIIPFIEDKK